MKGFPHILFHEAPNSHEEIDEETVMRSLSNREVESHILFDVVINPSLFERPGHLLDEKSHLVNLLGACILYSQLGCSDFNEPSCLDQFNGSFLIRYEGRS